jgi:exopolyphosphatase/guanosine-5'-triphosphate,3'-diphosphate pyrophosphatase
MNRWIVILISLIILVLVSFAWFRTESMSRHTEIRAALDIGSGATNLKVAKVDLDTDKIISQIFEQSIPVPYQKHLEQSSNNTFDNEVMAQGIRAIKALKEIADSYHAKKVVAVATAAFRQANNAPQFAQEVEKQTGVRIRIINQDEEGILAFRAAVATSPVDAKHTVVWDIGGGSMQFATLTEFGTYLVVKGNTASIPFKNAVIQEIKKQNIRTTHSPNPLDEAQMQQTIQLAQKIASTTDAYMKNKITKPSTQVLAVGSLFNYGIRPLANNQKEVMPDQLEQATMKLVGKTDQELPGGSLSEVAVSNPLLVIGYMKELKISKIEILNVNNADGALTYPAYWDES